MQISYRWLKKISRIELGPLELAERLTRAGIEVEGMRDLGYLSGKLVFARIEKAAPHPDGDKLTVCEVNAGALGIFQVICGAPNARAGLVSLLALEGAHLPGDKTVKKTKIRGVESRGMLCSGSEVKWNTDREGILELPDDSPLGEPFDCLLEVKITPNRPDCLSLFGIARDIAALDGRELYAPQTRLRETMDPITVNVRVSVQDKQACPRYTCRFLRKAQIGESPAWLKRALESYGMRSVNNVVDVTNYVLIEYGHPLHAFDADRVTDKHIVVRKAERGERLELLDERVLELSEADLVIADKNRPIALAGVMGSNNSEITAATTNILLESAYFDPVTIRQTARRHDLRTDASYHFERGMDIRQTLPSLHRAAQLISELTGAEIVKGAIDSCPSIPPAPPITVHIPQASMILGTQLTPSAIANKLVHLGFETVRSDREQLIVRPPSYRCDVTLDVDIIEEIARLQGYDSIEQTTPYVPAISTRIAMDKRVRRTVSQSMVNAGFIEAINYSFIGRDYLKQCRCQDDRLATLLNPLTSDQNVMRPALHAGLLQNLEFNQRQGAVDMRLFEIGKIFETTEQPADPYQETWTLGCILTGNRSRDHWRRQDGEVDFYDLKGVFEQVLNDLGVTGFDIVPAEPPLAHLHPSRSAVIRVQGQVIGSLGEAHPLIIQTLDIKGRALIGEMALDPLVALANFDHRFRPIARYPRIQRDIAIILDRAMAAGGVENVIAESGGPLLVDVRLFDVYEGDRIDSDKKSLAYALAFQSAERTLREEEVDESLARIVETLTERFGATLRS